MHAHLRSTIAALALAAAGCSGGSPQSAAFVPAANPAPTMAPPISAAATAAAAPSGRLYLLTGTTTPSTITQYGLPGLAIERTTAGPNRNQPSAFAIDAFTGTAYVANEYAPHHQTGSIDVYPAGATAPARHITSGINFPLHVAVDARGNLYVVNAPSSITVYARGSDVPSQTITKGVAHPIALAFDRQGNLYAANFTSSTVTVYAPNATKPSRTLSIGAQPRALAFDANDDLYVLSDAAIAIFAAGSSTLARRIGSGLAHADAMAFDRNGDLYVADCEACAAVAPGNFVEMYRHGTMALTNAIMLPVGSAPIAMAFDQNDDLLVLNQGSSTAGGSIDLYAPGGNKPQRTASNIQIPLAMIAAP